MDYTIFLQGFFEAIVTYLQTFLVDLLMGLIGG